MKKYLDRYLDIQTKNKKPDTLKMIKSVLEDFFKYAGDNSITVEIIEDWIYTKNTQKTTQKQYIGLLRGFIDWCIDRDYCTGKNPAKIVLKDMGKANDRNPDKRKVFSLDEVKNMIKNTRHPRDRTILLTLAKTGCRANELVSIKIQNVDFERGFIKITNRKGSQNGNKDTWVPMDKELSESLKYWIAVRGNISSDALFTSYMDKGMSKINLWIIVQEAGKRVGIDDAHPHCFRHFMTDILMANRVNPIFVEYLRGDSKGRMTSYYSHPEKRLNEVKSEYLKAMPLLLV